MIRPPSNRRLDCRGHAVRGLLVDTQIRKEIQHGNVMTDCCWACGEDLSFASGTTGGFAIPIGDHGDAVPNSYIGDWSGVTCCKECFERHTLWSNRFLYLGYMLKDGRLELSSEEIAKYGSP